MSLNTPRFLSKLFGAALVLGSLGTSTALAQFEADYGGTATELGYYGVAQTSIGGYIAVGETNSAPSANTDIFITKTNSQIHSFFFQTTYNIGGNDIARDVIEMEDGDFVICGQTQNTGHTSTNDGFIMRIDGGDGSLVWLKTYTGTNAGTEEFHNILYYVTSAGAEGFAVCGRTNGAGAGGFDGLIMRTDINGTPVWSRAYGGAQDEYFIGLTQLIGSGADFVATGGSLSYTGGADLQVFTTRAAFGTGNNIWSNHYGTTTAAQGSTCAITAQYDPDGGAGILFTNDIIIAGHNTSTGNSEGYVLRLAPGTGNVLADATFGGGASNGWDEFRGVVEVGPNSTTQSSDLVLTGLFFNATNSHGNYDLVLGQIPGTLGAQRWFSQYGGLTQDQGFSVNIGFGLTGTTDQYSIIACGNTNSIAITERATSDLQKYLVLARANGDACTDVAFTTTRTVPGNTRNTASVNPVTVLTASPLTRSKSDRDLEHALCDILAGDLGLMRSSDGGSASIATAPPADDAIPSGPMSGYPDSLYVASEFNVTSSVSAPAEAVVSMTSYPSPLKRGQELNVDFNVNSAAVATITVTDMNGKNVYTGFDRQTGNTRRATISTARWNSGAYLVTITIGDRTETQRVVVID